VAHRARLQAQLAFVRVATARVLRLKRMASSLALTYPAASRDEAIGDTLHGK